MAGLANALISLSTADGGRVMVLEYVIVAARQGGRGPSALRLLRRRL